MAPLAKFQLFFLFTFHIIIPIICLHTYANNNVHYLFIELTIVYHHEYAMNTRKNKYLLM